MADLLADIVKWAFVPGSAGFLVVAMLAGVLLLYIPPLARWGRRWLVAVLLLYVAFATPLVSQWLQRGTRPVDAPVTADADAAGASAVVVLGNGIVSYTHDGRSIDGLTRRTAFNVLEGARLYRLLAPRVIIASGGLADPEVGRPSEAEAIRNALIDLGVPGDRIVTEAISANTHQQAERLVPLLASHPRFVLVTSPIHMPRAMALFEAQGLRPIPSPSPIDYGTTRSGLWQRLVPSAAALRASELSMYEYLGFAYGWTRGWLDAGRDAPQ